MGNHDDGSAGSSQTAGPPGIGTGMGLGCVGLIGATVVGLVSLDVSSTVVPGPLGFLWPFITLIIVGALLMIRPRTRQLGGGLLLVTLTLTVVVIGPCSGLLTAGL